MKEMVIAICILLFVLAVFLIVRAIRNAIKGKCCEGCKSCNLREQCSAAEKTDNKE